MPQLCKLLHGHVVGRDGSEPSVEHRGDDGRVDEVLLRRVPAAADLHAGRNPGNRRTHSGEKNKLQFGS